MIVHSSDSMSSDSVPVGPCIDHSVNTLAMPEVEAVFRSVPPIPWKTLVDHTGEVCSPTRLTISDAVAMIRYLLLGLYADRGFDKLSNFGRSMVAILLRTLQAAAEPKRDAGAAALTFFTTDLPNVLRVMEDAPVLAAAVSTTHLVPMRRKSWLAVSDLLYGREWYHESARAYSRGCAVAWLGDQSWRFDFDECGVSDITAMIEAIDQIVHSMLDPSSMPYDLNLTSSPCYDCGAMPGASHGEDCPNMD